MNDVGLLSVIVPVYKVEKYLCKCVDSILNQTYRNLEIILVDDGSPDNCPAICDEYAAKDSRVKVIHQLNGGLCSARNVGIEKAKGDFISFIDSDDWIELTMFEEMLDYLQQNDLDVVCCDTKSVKGNKEHFKPRYKTNKIFAGQEGLNEILAGTLDNSACNKIYKRKCIGDIKFPVGRRYEDVARVYLFLANANKVGYICKGLYYYVKRQDGFIGQSFNSQSRYECFLGYKERLIYASNHKLPCVEQCRVNAIETALSTLTAFYATGESENSDRFKDVTKFIRENGIIVHGKLKRKHAVLLWIFFNVKNIHRIYAWLSGVFKNR